MDRKGNKVSGKRRKRKKQQKRNGASGKGLKVKEANDKEIRKEGI